MHVRMHNHNACTVVHCPARSSLVSHEHFPASQRMRIGDTSCVLFFLYNTDTHRESEGELLLITRVNVMFDTVNPMLALVNAQALG